MTEGKVTLKDITEHAQVMSSSKDGFTGAVTYSISDRKNVDGIFTVDELLKFRVVTESLITESKNFSIRRNAFHIISTHCLIEMNQSLKEIITLLRRSNDIPETDEEREVRIDKEVEDAKNNLDEKGKGRMLKKK